MRDRQQCDHVGGGFMEAEEFRRFGTPGRQPDYRIEQEMADLMGDDVEVEGRRDD